MGLQLHFVALAFPLHFWFYSHLAVLNNPCPLRQTEGAATAADGRQKRKDAAGIQPRLRCGSRQRRRRRSRRKRMPIR